MYIYLVFVATIVLGSINGSESRSGRILGGEPSQISDYPYTVQLEYNDYFVCGGSIIAEDIILTAAHCVYNRRDNLKVRAHATFRYDVKGMVRSVETVIVHERYRHGELFSDIAILKLESPLAYGPGIWPIAMFNHNEVTPLVSAYVSGWGYAPELNNRATQIRVVELPIVDKTECARQYMANYHVEPPRGLICAGVASRKDACSGDSGGPLAINGRLAGIVSGGPSCESSRTPGVYTEVAYFRHWIDDKINQLRFPW